MDESLRQGIMVLGLSSELVIALKFSLSTGNTEKGYSVIANWAGIVVQWNGRRIEGVAATLIFS